MKIGENKTSNVFIHLFIFERNSVFSSIFFNLVPSDFVPNVFPQFYLVLSTYFERKKLRDESLMLE